MLDTDKLKKYLIENYNCHTIILYGSFANGTENEESDIDVICFSDNIKNKNDNNIFNKRVLDCWVYNTDFMKKVDELIHLNDGKILLDKRGLGKGLLFKVNEKIKDCKKLSKEEIEFQKSWIVKMLNRSKRGDVEGDFRYHWLLVDSIEIYFSIIGLRYLGPKKSLLYLKDNDVEAYDLFQKSLKINAKDDNLDKLVQFILRK